MMFRSTKGASKQRRDLINVEILQIRDLLPLSEAARQRLSQLQIMSLACCYIRKTNSFTKLFGNDKSSNEVPFEFSQALGGFIIAANQEGKLLYVSESVTDYLGHSMVDMLTQGDSLYDVVDKRDYVTMQSHLRGDVTAARESEFFCRMNVARSLRRQSGYGDYKVMHVRGRLAKCDHFGKESVFLAVVTPLLTPDTRDNVIAANTNCFRSIFSLDLKFQEISHSGQHHIGHSTAELNGRSFYDVIHAEDLLEVRDAHAHLVRAGSETGAMCCARVQTRDLSYKWTHLVLQLKPSTLVDADSIVVGSFQLIDEHQVSGYRDQCHQHANHSLKSHKYMQAPPASLGSGDVSSLASPMMTSCRSEVLLTQGAMPSPIKKEMVQGRLKRKLQQQRQCVSKQPRFSNVDSSCSGSFDIDDFLNPSNTSTFSSLVAFQTLDSIDCGAVVTQQETRAPVYAQLKMAEHLRRAPALNPKVNHLASACSSGSPGPLTPESFASEIVTSPADLSIDIVDCVFGPHGFSSPSLSPQTSPTSVAEQCVPTLVEEMEHAIKMADRNVATSRTHLKEAKMTPQEHLPVLDASYVNTFFFSLDSKQEVENGVDPLLDAFTAPSPNDVSVVDIDLNDFDWREMASLASPSCGDAHLSALLFDSQNL